MGKYSVTPSMIPSKAARQAVMAVSVVEATCTVSAAAVAGCRIASTARAPRVAATALRLTAAVWILFVFTVAG
ncbi:unannotated protein [freshwater metagenome]|uniref:Unannotated protein n=1 Tax=freshwater metagenome TaxID=449393 RepID=A0A6J7SKB3_9ZZZZ